jgi:hypothetical protein
MAVLTVSSLTGCNSIPSFLGGSADTPSNPSIVVFRQTSAPTNWTKVTTWDNRGLRVIGAANGGPITTGGTLPFTQTFANRTVGPAQTSSDGVTWTVGQTTLTFASPTTGDMTGFPGFAQPTTLATTQQPPHTHTFNRHQSGSTAAVIDTAPTITVGNAGAVTTAVGPGGWSPLASSHTHPVSAPHTHTISGGTHSHTNSPGAHSHPYSTTYDFSITYVDVILATKN